MLPSAVLTRRAVGLPSAPAAPCCVLRTPTRRASSVAARTAAAAVAAAALQQAHLRVATVVAVPALCIGGVQAVDTCASASSIQLLLVGLKASSLRVGRRCASVDMHTCDARPPRSPGVALHAEGRRARHAMRPQLVIHDIAPLGCHDGLAAEAGRCAAAGQEAARGPVSSARDLRPDAVH
jgi:hypothetical protein